MKDAEQDRIIRELKQALERVPELNFIEAKTLIHFEVQDTGEGLFSIPKSRLDLAEGLYALRNNLPKLLEKLEQQQSKSVRSGILCAKWKKLEDGCVARCDQPHGHEGKHLDSVILISWGESVSATSGIDRIKELEGALQELYDRYIGGEEMSEALMRTESVLSKEATK